MRSIALTSTPVGQCMPSRLRHEWNRRTITSSGGSKISVSRFPIPRQSSAAAGAFLRRPAIGTGLMFGGIFSICDGYFNNWSKLADVLKFGSLLVAFGLLIFLGYRRLERKEVAT